MPTFDSALRPGCISLLCEKVQIVWSHFKSVQDEYDHSFLFVFSFLFFFGT